MSPTVPPPVLLALAGVFAIAGAVGLLPRPRGRSVLLGAAFTVAAVLFGAVFVSRAFGDPLPDLVGQILFWLFSGVALAAGAVLVTQKNPARGAIAFAFVVISTCGLFVLLAAPFLAAATVIVYAGAIIVTFLFVLMLSHAGGPSDENDRTRDPLMGSVGGYGFAALVLFALYQTAHGDFALPTPPLSAEDRGHLAAAQDALAKANEAGKDELLKAAQTAHDHVAEAVGGKDASRVNKPAAERLKPAAANPRVGGVVAQAQTLRAKNDATLAGLENNLLGPAPDPDRAKRDLAALRDELTLFAGNGHLPARNVGTIGLLLYTEHLLAVELAGTLLLVATVGAVAIAGKKGAVA
jgi:NADH-quinone oxidoreductase subunit J